MEIINMGISTKHSPGEFCLRHCFEHYTISCFSTPYLYERENKIIPGGSGDVVINSPGEPVYHGDVYEGGKGFVNDWLYIGGADTDEIIKKHAVPLNSAIHTGNKYFLRVHFENIRNEKIMKQPGSGEMIKAIFEQMIIEIRRAATCCRGDARSRIERARYAIMKNPQNDYTVDSLAKLCGYSAGRFAHLYTETYGITPMQSIMNARINMAKSLLEYGGLSVSDAAAACGFRNIYYFSKCFKQKTGISPSEYKKQ